MNDAITCSGPECDRAVSRRGLCVTHYSQGLKGKPLTVIRVRKDRRAASPCRFPGCGRAVSYIPEDLCDAHAHQFKTGAQLTAIADRVGRYAPGALCHFEGCDARAYSRGLCQRHYNQSRSGDLRPLGPKKILSTTRNERGEKQCYTCQTWRDESQFARNRSAKDGLQGMCSPCKAAHYRENAEVVRDKMREARFGITREQFDALFESQGHVCATCGTDDPGTSYWAVDHDHACCPGSDNTCGKCIRGILCRACNHALGNVRDNPETLARLIDYLKEGHVTIPNPTRTRSAR